MKKTLGSFLLKTIFFVGFVEELYEFDKTLIRCLGKKNGETVHASIENVATAIAESICEKIYTST